MMCTKIPRAKYMTHFVPNRIETCSMFFVQNEYLMTEYKDLSGVRIKEQEARRDNKKYPDPIRSDSMSRQKKRVLHFIEEEQSGQRTLGKFSKRSLFFLLRYDERSRDFQSCYCY